MVLYSPTLFVQFSAAHAIVIKKNVLLSLILHLNVLRFDNIYLFSITATGQV